MEVKVDIRNFESLLQTDKPVMIDFWAAWCGPCRMLGPVIEEVAKEFEGKAVVGKCNIDENDELANAMRISAVPAVYFFKNGKVVDTVVGVNPKAVYVNKLNSLL
ncbi:MAG: thioredoxin [Candidatus Cryptobacteroides sp.]